MRNSALIAQIWACRNCLRQLYFKSKWRGIGYSFQLAITAPLYSITGYRIATAQSCLNWYSFHRCSILPRKPCWNQNITLNDAQMRSTSIPNKCLLYLDMFLSNAVQIYKLTYLPKIVVNIVYYDQANSCLIHFYKRCVSTTDSYKCHIIKG